eukprot:gnl/MRDRNA2_/MRDRNA2_114441_c0_seq1.p1 gnl/MRDRNA2_/MRDRNA2_114441_c0~~gnl/MRDRNA2_/MRDRNA2_114441_c0_seq1.p1  ORF type:complete len:212 (-),score=24.91 gnl/MRDRNA2_/MRDRNA2_114441_c0_seq1:117-713(-)
MAVSFGQASLSRSSSAPCAHNNNLNAYLNARRYRCEEKPKVTSQHMMQQISLEPQRHPFFPRFARTSAPERIVAIRKRRDYEVGSFEEVLDKKGAASVLQGEAQGGIGSPFQRSQAALDHVKAQFKGKEWGWENDLHGSEYGTARRAIAVGRRSPPPWPTCTSPEGIRPWHMQGATCHSAVPFRQNGWPYDSTRGRGF